MSSDLPCVNPATLNGIFPYYHLITKWSGLGDSTELSQVWLSQSEDTTVQQGYIAVTLHKSILLSYLPQTILKVTPRSTILLIASP
jgi:hypothetical protein